MSNKQRQTGYKPPIKVPPREEQTPASVQQMLAYPPVPLTVDGEKYLLGFNDQDAKGRFEAIIGGKVWDRVYEEAERMKPLTAERHIKRHEDLFSSGFYATGGEGWQREGFSATGVYLFFLSLLQEHQPEMESQDAARLFNADPRRCKHAIAAVAPDFFRAILRQIGATEESIQELAPQMAEGMALLTQDDETPEPATS